MTVAIQQNLQQILQVHQAGELHKANTLYKEFLNINSRHAEAWYLWGILRYQVQDYAQSIVNLEKAIEIEPRQPIYYATLASPYIDQRQFSQAIDLLHKALELDAQSIDAWVKLGFVHHSQSEFQKALDCYKKAMDISDQYPPLWVAMAITFESLAKIEDAKQCLEKALKIDPNHLDALNNLSNILINMGKTSESETMLGHLLSLQPNHPAALCNMGKLKLMKRQYPKAIELFNHAIQLNNNFSVAKINLAEALRGNKNYSEAKQLYQDILVNPSSYTDPLHSPDFIQRKALVGLTLCCACVCDWEATEKFKPMIANEVKELPYSEEPFIDPSESITIGMDWKTHAKLSKCWVEHYQKRLHAKHTDKQLNVQGRIKIAYLSPDFGNHPVGLMIADLLTFHDRLQFEVFAFSLKRHDNEINRTIQKAVDNYIEMDGMSIDEIVNVLEKHSLDILIDLAGHTRDAQPSVLLAKTAPIQIHWLGQAASLHMNTIDYYVTHWSQTPESLQSQFMEKLLYLPSLISIDKTKPRFRVSNTKPKRADYQLPQNAIVFCCFNQEQRIDRTVYNTWMEILSEVENSVLWLSSKNAECRENLLQYTANAGIDTSRIIFRPPKYFNDDWHHQLADIYLDTLMESGGTTALFSILIGLPVITLAGKNAPNRIGAVFSTLANAPELATHDIEEYKKLAIELALNKHKRQALRDKILASHENSLLFNPKAFMHILETSFKQMLMQYPNLKNIDASTLGDTV